MVKIMEKNCENMFTNTHENVDTIQIFFLSSIPPLQYYVKKVSQEQRFASCQIGKAFFSLNIFKARMTQLIKSNVNNIFLSRSFNDFFWNSLEFKRATF